MPTSSSRDGTDPASGTAPGPAAAEPAPEAARPARPARPANPARDQERAPRRVVIDPGGPVLVEGPVEVDLGDGRTAVSDRFMVALCACRRSRDYPWCDTSHRRRSRPGNSPQTPGT